MNASVFRKPGVPVAAPRQLVSVTGAGATRSPGVHGADQPSPVLVRADRGAVPSHGEHPVHVFDSDGPEHGMCHRSVHIIQRRGVRTQAQGLIDVRPERVLLRWDILRVYRVRNHRQLEEIADLQHHVSVDQRCGIVNGEFGRKHKVWGSKP